MGQVAKFGVNALITIGNTHFMRIFIISFCWLFLINNLPAQQPSKLLTKASSHYLVTGEIGYFSIGFDDRDTNSPPPRDIDVAGLNIQMTNFYATTLNHRRRFVYTYRVSAANPGTYTIPPQANNYYGNTIYSTPVTFTVLPREQLHYSEMIANGRTIPCYSYLFAKNETLYPAETTQIEYKVYLPSNTRILQWGLPIPEASENCTAWRFKTPNSANEYGKAIIDGRDYIVASFTTVLSGLEPGKASFGPLTTRIVTSAVTTDPLRGFVSRRTDLTPTTPAKTFTVQPYPSAPPTSFQGAVGDFHISAEQPEVKTLKLSDSISLSVEISGSGNLPLIVAPEITNKEDWKVIDVSKSQRGDERKERRGSVKFKYILQPKATAQQTPSFRFTHFNPTAKEFLTEVTSSSAITVLAAENLITPTVQPVKADSPVENMQDILGPLSEPSLQPNLLWLRQLPSWTWQLIPAVLVLYIFVLAGIKRYRLHQFSNAERLIKKQQLKELASVQDDFLPRAAAYIQRWHGETSNQQVREILQQRDLHCYQPEQQQGIDQRQRSAILKTLKKLSLALALSCLFIPNNLQAENTPASAQQAWNSGDYSSALEQNLALSEQYPHSADLYYNIGNCYYRLQQPGQAALYYSKALSLSAEHPEARKNLDFIQSQQASILPAPLSKSEQWLALFSYDHYQQACFASLWLLAICLLVLILHRPKGKQAGFTISGLSMALLLSSATFYGCYLHPFKPLSKESATALITARTPLLTEPIQPLAEQLEQKTLLEIPVASPCLIIAQRDSWSYVELANKSRGWVPRNLASPINISEAK